MTDEELNLHCQKIDNCYKAYMAKHEKDIMDKPLSELLSELYFSGYEQAEKENAELKNHLTELENRIHNLKIKNKGLEKHNAELKAQIAAGVSRITEIEKKAEEYLITEGFSGDCNNITSYEANTEIEKAYIAGYEKGENIANKAIEALQNIVAEIEG